MEDNTNGLLGITYSEFDNKVGPRLLFSYPNEVISSETFETLSDYVIVGKHLCNKIIAIKTDEFQFINYSVAIDNAKYERNTLLFSFGFVLSLSTAKERYEPVLRKISNVFLNLEIEREFLFQENTKSKLKHAFSLIYHQLMKNNEALLNFDDFNFLAIKIFDEPVDPPNINDYEVPVLKYDPTLLQELPWDITLKYLVERIDGISHVKKLTMKEDADVNSHKESNKDEMNMDIDIVKRAIRHLKFYDCIIMADVLQFSNKYQLTKNIYLLQRDLSILNEIQEFCSIDLSVPPTYQSIMKILLKLGSGLTVGEMIESIDHKFFHGIDIRRLIAICQEHLLIRRIHEFPLYIPSGVYNDTINDRQIGSILKTALHGNEHLDSICCTKGISHKDIETLPNIVIVYK